jgi:hypothetical protein
MVKVRLVFAQCFHIFRCRIQVCREPHGHCETHSALITQGPRAADHFLDQLAPCGAVALSTRLSEILHCAAIRSIHSAYGEAGKMFWNCGFEWARGVWRLLVGGPE